MRIKTKTRDKIKSVKLILSAKLNEQFDMDKTMVYLADKFLAESKENKQ